MMSDSSVSDYFIADKNGKVLYCGDCEDGNADSCSAHKDFIVNENHIERALDGGFSDYMTDEDFGIGKFVVAVPIKNGHDIIAIAFAIEDAVTGLLPYVASISQFMAYAVCFVLLFMFIIIYFITRGITKPLEDMQEVTRHIAKGEFDYRASEDYKQKDINDFAKQLNKMAFELAIDDESRKSFVANVSHELKTPMTTIGGFIDGILDGTIEPERQSYYLGIVSDEVKRLSRLVQSMLSMARLESGEFPLKPELFDLSALLCSIVISQEQRIEQKKLNIIGLDGLENISVNADRDLLHQAIYNLVDNAIKFSEEGGNISFELKTENKKTVLTVINTGKGIPEKELPFVFERFYKVDKSRSASKNSTGLGLYIVKTIITAHGGTVAVSSKENEFTAFKVTLP
jgi:signal transduction histidine kinase